MGDVKNGCGIEGCGGHLDRAKVVEVIEKHGDWFGWSSEFDCYARFCDCGMWMDSGESARYSRKTHAAHVTSEIDKLSPRYRPQTSRETSE